MHARLFLAACASAALLTACNGNNNTSDTDQTKTAPPNAATSATGTSGAEDQAKPIAVTGCLQKDGGDYILTQINEPPKGEPVAEQDLKEAEHSYRLNAKNTSDDNWKTLVGHEVRVSGTVAKTSDLDQKVGTSGSSDHPKIKEGDLAKVDVNDIQQVSANCGAHAKTRRQK